MARDSSRPQDGGRRAAPSEAAAGDTTAGIECAPRHDMQWLLACAVAAHGVAHLPGFVSAWRLAELSELPYRTTLLGGRLDVGDAGMRIVGGLWLLLAVAFVAAAVGLATHAGWVTPLLRVAAIASMVWCLTAWPEARIGVAVNVGLIVVLAANARLNLTILVP